MKTLPMSEDVKVNWKLDMAPSVSVIIPVFNAEKWISECLGNVRAQSCRNIEILCVNDASTDRSLEILTQAAATDARIRIIHFAVNKGVSAARNAALNMASGEYICFVDADDIIETDFISNLYQEAKNHDLDLVKGPFKIVNGEEIKESFVINQKVKENKFNLHMDFPSVLYRKSLLTKNNILFNEDIAYTEDRIFMIRAVYYAKTIGLVESGGSYLYIRHFGSVTNRPLDIKTVRNIANGYIRLFTYIKDMDIDEHSYEILYQEFFLGYLSMLNTNRSFIGEIWHELALLVDLLKYQHDAIEKFKIAIQQHDANGLLKAFHIHRAKLLSVLIRKQKLQK